MILKLTGLSLYVLALFLAGCSNQGPDIVHHYSYTNRPAQDSALNIHVSDEFTLDVPINIKGFDSITVLFPSTGKELTFERTLSEGEYIIKPIIPIDSLFKQNDSVQVLFRRKNKIIFKPFLIKEIDTIDHSGSGTFKLC